MTTTKLRNAFPRLSTLTAGALALTLGVAPVLAQFGQPQKPTGPWMDKTLTADQRADLIVKVLTLDEKIALLHDSGWDVVMAGPDKLPPRALGNAGFIPGIPRLGIPDLQMADAAVGVTHSSVFGRYSTPLPSGIAEASSWDIDLAREYGSLIGRELRDQGYTMSLGGGIDLTREPRNGRNFEYRGEDPILAGALVGAEMKALQAQHIIGNLKHYAMNDQESGRSFVNVKVGKRAMRESDLLAFEIALKGSGAGAVMCSYNLVNGDYACENNYLLNQVLKKDFGFQGFVISDWSATHSTAKAADAGLDMEMPEDTYFGAPLKKAVESGEVPMARLDNMVHRVLRSEFAVGLFDNPPDRRVPDVFHGLEVAERVAEQSIVLLRNANGQLPLAASNIHSIAMIGSHADAGVLSGAGSGQVDPIGGNAVPGAYAFGQVWHRSSPLKAIRAEAPGAKVAYDPGTDASAAAALAKASDVAIVFVNQPAGEGNDVPSLSLPGRQDALVSAVAAANPHTIVVVESGGPVTMPWIDRVNAVLEAWYPGTRGGEAIARILFGEVNPSAKLPVTFAKTEADLPHPKEVLQPPPRQGEEVPMFPGAPWKINTRRFDIDYDEGLLVGYKWYDAKDKQPLFPFGYGLSYTTYSYSGLKVSPAEVTFEVKNTGTRAGAEIAEVYATLPQSAGEPFKRLVTFQKIALEPGESKSVTLDLNPHYLSVFNEDKDGWELVAGEYTVQVGGSSRDLPLRGTFRIER
ncbi:MAG: glycoside hydrolase family 3 C-terminal domain-containing protein [Bryobacteraceae bacterium]|jgi:beta-glucosidase